MVSFFEEYGEQELYQIDQNTPIEHYLMVSDAAEIEDIDLFWKESVKESGVFSDRQSLISENNDDYFLFLLDGSKIVGALSFTLEYERNNSDNVDEFPDEIIVNFSLNQLFILKRYRGFGLSKMLLDELIAMLLDELLIPYFERNPVNNEMVTFYQYSKNIECEFLSFGLNVRLEGIMNRLTANNHLPVINYDLYSGVEEVDNLLINNRLRVPR